MVKSQFRPSRESCKVKSISFSTADYRSIRQSSVVHVVNKKLYHTDRRRPAISGPLDRKMGSSLVGETCSTCGLTSQNCSGHFGHIDLQLPIFHAGFFRQIIQILQSICKNCCKVLLNANERAQFRRRLNVPFLTYIALKKIHKSILDRCKAISRCPHCNYVNGKVKAVPGQFMKIVHDRSKVRREDPSLKQLKSSVKHDSSTTNGILLLNATVVYNLFQRIPATDVPFFVMDKASGHPCNLIARRVPVPPATIRPSVVSTGGTNEDDLTVKVSEMVLLNHVIRRSQVTDTTTEKLMESWQYLQMLHALYLNSQVTGLPPQLQTRKFTRCLAQRLKGKEGRFRKNLSGKRVDFSGRTVISPDPNLQIFEVGVPKLVAMNLTFPERVCQMNIDSLRAAVLNGPDKHPGAVYFCDRNSSIKKYLTVGNRQKIAQGLKYGDMIERHMKDGDVVLFNRQPSLHKLSVMAHFAKVLPYKTFRFNECVCTPYNADFDGDEMNLHFPQTHEARAEAITLMNVKHNLVTPRNGEPLVAAIQDFITGAYLLTQRDFFLGKRQLWKLVGSLITFPSGGLKVDLPKPAILKPAVLWTGKQVFSLIIRPHKECANRLNVNVKGKSYTGNRELCVKESYAVIRNGQLLAGVMEKSLIGSGSKVGIFYMLMRDFGPQAAVDAMWRLSRLTSSLMMERGFSIGIGDVTPSKQLLDEKSRLVSAGYSACDSYIEQMKSGRLTVQPGCTAEETLEAVILKELSVIRDHAGRACVAQLNRHNPPLLMALSGSKGSIINISQMIACVGQQAIGGQRPPDGFTNRCLPHFEKGNRTPHARGFVDASFYSGLHPHQFFFHAMAGREGLIDTAVKTAETGYMQRRLVKCLEDLCIHYDNSVRDSVGGLVQFQYGGDGIDPAHVECSESVINLQHAWEHSMNTLRQSGQLAVHASVMRHELESHLESNKKLYEKLFVQSFRSFCEEKFRQTDETMGEGGAKKELLARGVLAKNSLPSSEQWRGFLKMCADKYRRSLAEPGSAIGAIAATSVGEPSTQMTLKTFHFAGVASMNITQGVPRIREIVNAVRSISTPVVTVFLQHESDERFARLIKGRIERTKLSEVTEYVECVYHSDSCFLLFKISTSRLRLLQLEITTASIVNRLLGAKLLVRLLPKHLHVCDESTILVEVEETKKMSAAALVIYLRDALLNVVVHGLATVNRCIIQADERSGQTMRLLVETNDLLHVLAVPGVDGTRTVCNNPVEIASTLGIEASRTAIISEIQSTMANHGIGLDVRHLMVVSDMMTYAGEVTGMTRQGLPKVKDSVILQASFEKTTDHLYAAAYHGHEDPVCGVSESIIMGTPISLGTGMMDVLYKKENVSFNKRSVFFDSFQLQKDN